RALLLLAMWTCAASAQSLDIIPISITFRSPLPKADAVVIGTMISGQVRTQGFQILIDGRLRIDRSIQGEFPPGEPIAVSWQFMSNPMHGPAAEVPKVSALWFLTRKGDFY